ncbi:MAG: hypothetical protein EBR82_07965 [Caulobacteraceae bacterium]|nr:hypothetical protein [Caulobacteraceae bacterium]
MPPPRPAVIVPAECTVPPAPRTPFQPPDLPTLAALDSKNPLPHWISRTSRAETLATALLGEVDRILTEDRTRDALAESCARWADRVAREQAGQ